MPGSFFVSAARKKKSHILHKPENESEGDTNAGSSFK